MYEKIRDRYQKYYITDSQLDRYVALGVITEEQAASIREERVPDSEGGDENK